MTNNKINDVIESVKSIIQSASNDNGWMSESEYNRVNADLRKLGITVITTQEPLDLPVSVEPTVDDIIEVSIHPFVQQIADENGEEIEGDWSNASGGEYSDEFGDELDDYPDAMFRKGWSVSTWTSVDGDIDEEFDDYETAIARAADLADKHGAVIDHRY